MQKLLPGLLLLLACSGLKAQDSDPAPVAPPAAASSAAQQTALPPPSVHEKWKFFLKETATPLIALDVLPGATLSQMTHSAPLYGRNPWRHEAFLKRVGAIAGDTVSANFFSDFLLASAFHEDTRYVAKGPSSHHGLIWRFGYAISRSVVTHTDAGADTFDFANVIGCGMSAALSNAYYPPLSRTRAVSLTNWGTGIASSGFSNLMPEFGPGVGRFFKRHLFHRDRH